MDFLKKIQNLPLWQRKIILWLIIVIIGLCLITLYIKNIKNRFKNLEKEEIKGGLNLPKFELPQFKLPEIPQEEMK